jgi:hypothetical protein
VKDKNGDLLVDFHNILDMRNNCFSHLLNMHSVGNVRQIEMHTAKSLVRDTSPFEI